MWSLTRWCHGPGFFWDREGCREWLLLIIDRVGITNKIGVEFGMAIGMRGRKCWIRAGGELLTGLAGTTGVVWAGPPCGGWRSLVMPFGREVV